MFLESLFTINPDAEKLSIITDSYITTPTQYYGEEIIDLRKDYLCNNSLSFNNIESIKDVINDLHYSSDDELSISSNVLAQCYLVLDTLYPTIIDNLKTENVYSTPYGTMIFEWEQDQDNVFSLEISAKGIGYFIEKNGTDIKQLDNLILEDSKIILLNDLSNFLTK